MNDWRKIFERLAQAVLVLPVAVTLIVAITIAIGGHCDWWQWWLPLIVIMFACKIGLKVHEWGVVVGLFALVMFGVWLGVGLFAMCNSWDQFVYHEPAIRLLIKGWNPVYQGSESVLVSEYGVNPEELRLLHILVMPKGIWYFSAASYYFTHTWFNLSGSIYPLLFLGMAYEVASFWGRKHIVLSMLLCGLILLTMPDGRFVIDAVVGMSAIGLLTSFANGSKYGRWRILSIVCFSFWMCVAKQPSMLHCIIFWAFISVCLIAQRKYKSFVKLLTPAAAIAVIVIPVLISPYATSWINFGHPLYPRYHNECKGGENQLDITGDFFNRNYDAASMGHFEAFANAYISPGLVGLCRKILRGETDFCPYSGVWKQSNPKSMGWGCPTSSFFRICFLTLSFVVVVFGGAVNRLFALLIWVCMLCMPTEMLGYIRYVPFYPYLLIAVAEIMISGNSVGRLISRVLCAVVFIAVLMNVFPSRLSRWNASVEAAYLWQRFISTGGADHMYVKDRQSRANARLLVAMMPNLKHFQIYTCECEPNIVPYELACDLPISAFDRNDISWLRVMQCVDQGPISRINMLLMTVKSFVKGGTYLLVERLSTKTNKSMPNVY